MTSAYSRAGLERRSTIFENQFLFSKNFTFRTIVLKTEYFIDMQVP